ncbi:sulfatase [Thalassoglobus neptunius]|nr:sulfatase-like hydrolase/transferase [Thalassoglobus neptunius]
MMFRIFILMICCWHASFLAAADERPNFLFICVDDLNDWIGCLGGHPQAITPNFDRLAASGVLFTNAYCPAASCNPSRTAVMTGISPHVSGLYANRQSMRQVLPDAQIIPKYFSEHGYWSGGSGKILHYFIDADSWTEYFPEAESENPFPRTLYPSNRPVSLPRAGDWQYIETDWGALDATDEEFGGDYLVSEWVSEQLKKKRDQPFWLACGFYRPHEPWFVPKRYFDRVPPVSSIRIPPGWKPGDLIDVPERARALARNRYFPHIQAHGEWRNAIQAYLASIAFADEMLGRVLDALEEGPNADSTIVILWSDHGWHLGEKEHWQKYTAWRVCARVPLMIRVPPGFKALPEGTPVGAVCSRPVSLLDLFPTMTELAGIPEKSDNDGRSIVPLLKDPEAEWDEVPMTHLDRPGVFSLSGEKHRYIRYIDGSEELYNIEDDPYEWTNLASNKYFADVLAQFRELIPEDFAPKILPPAKRPSLTITNQTGEFLELFWLPENAESVPLKGIEVGESRRIQTTIGHQFRVQSTSGRVHEEFECTEAEQTIVIPTSDATDAGEVAFVGDKSKNLNHQSRDIEGWTVYVDEKLLSGEQEALGETALRLLEDKLFELNCVCRRNESSNCRRFPSGSTGSTS